MNHVMLDCYGANATLLENLKYINKIMNELPFVLGITPVNPPTLIPYYYGKVKEDDGVSAFVILEDGHLTIHTFPFRKAYFLDIFTEKGVDSSVIINYLKENLPYNAATSILNDRDRDVPVYNVESKYNPKDDFGPHVLAEVEVDKDTNMENIYDFLEQLVSQIGMTPIIRPYVLKNKIKNHRYISGITMIAESHISLHFDKERRIIYADVFSCTSFDFSMVIDIFKTFGKVISYEVVARGTKHYSIIASNKEDFERVASDIWKKNIY